MSRLVDPSPTGIVALARVVHLLIAEFGAEPRWADWQAVLGGEGAP